MRVNPEIVDVEGADDLARVRRLHRVVNCPSHGDLPGAWAHIETSREHTEQERPSTLPREGDEPKRGKTEARTCKWVLGVGLPHSSDEAVEGVRPRVGGAKGGAGQGTCWRER